ncbi:hypothetical protein DM860_017569 [Cuscuta australis]|uniref:Uncharacterized protein n=1 Tax=Cuscuta australis TaxID=267555 RepID=A0A328DY48_9ASTE|nr:hypothetical protein DM860_017569 [Cuscuta australis]
MADYNLPPLPSPLAEFKEQIKHADKELKCQFCFSFPEILGESKVDGWTLKNRIVKDEPETNQGWWGLGLGVYGHGLDQHNWFLQALALTLVTGFACAFTLTQLFMMERVTCNAMDSYDFAFWLKAYIFRIRTIKHLKVTIYQSSVNEHFLLGS